MIARDKVIMRWLAHRGGALDFRDHCEASPGAPFPVAVALGADPATILGAVTPVPDTLSEYQFAGLLRGGRTEVVKCMGCDLEVPASAEIVLEGAIRPGESALEGRDGANAPPRPRTGYEMALEGPFGDHTGYYNEQERFPVLTLERITMRRDPIYHSTYTGKPPDEPAVLGLALNEVFVPILRKPVPRDHRLLPAAGGLLVSPRGSEHEEAVPGPRQAGDVRDLELPAAVHVHQDRRGGGRRRRTPATGRK